MSLNKLKLNDIELRHLIKAVVEYRNNLIKNNKNSPNVDELLIKIMNSQERTR